MSIRDEEIKRLIHYAKGMGVKVILHQKNKSHTSAEWTTDGSQIDIYIGKTNSKTDTLLDLIHELGHHVWFIHEKNRQPDLKFEEALDRTETNDAPKHLRKKILDVEKAGTEYWEIIYKETDMRFPKWKLEASMEFDVWMYEQYHETGKFPKGLFKRTHNAEVRLKHRERARK